MRISDWSSDVCSSDLRNFLMTKIAIIVGSTRPGRLGAAVAEWVNQVASRRTDAEFEIVDNADFALPLLYEPLPARMGQYERKSVVLGKRGAVRLNLGGRRIVKNKHQKNRNKRR